MNKDFLFSGNNRKRPPLPRAQLCPAPQQRLAPQLRPALQHRPPLPARTVCLEAFNDKDIGGVATLLRSLSLSRMLLLGER